MTTYITLFSLTDAGIRPPRTCRAGSTPPRSFWPSLKDIRGAPDAEKQRFDAYRAQKGLHIVSDTIR